VPLTNLDERTEYIYRFYSCIKHFLPSSDEKTSSDKTPANRKLDDKKMKVIRSKKPPTPTALKPQVKFSKNNKKIINAWKHINRPN
jgi:hypothetical protein